MTDTDLDLLLDADAPTPSSGFDRRVRTAIAASGGPTLDDLLDADRPEPSAGFDARVRAALDAADRPTVDDLLDADRPEPGSGFDDRVLAAIRQADDRPVDAQLEPPTHRGARVLSFPARWPLIGAALAAAAALALWLVPGDAGPTDADLAFADTLDLLEVYEEMQVFDGIADDETFDLVAALHTIDPEVSP